MIIFHLFLAWLILSLFTILLFIYGFYILKLLMKIFTKLISANTSNLVLKTQKNRKIILFLIALNTGLYIQQCYEWMSPKTSANINAKAYYCAGNVLNIYRRPLSPNNPLVYWFVYPQKILYHLASYQIPESDGELAIYGYHWFVYPFARNFSHLHAVYENLLGIAKEIPTYDWEFLKASYKDSFKDKNIREKHILRDLPLAALYFDYISNHNSMAYVYTEKGVEEEILNKPVIYDEQEKEELKQLHEMNERHKKNKDSIKLYLGNKTKSRSIEEHIEKYRKKLDENWLDVQKTNYITTIAYESLKALKGKWEKSDFMKEQLKKHKTMEASRKAAMLSMLERGALYAKFDDKTLSCTHPYTLHFVKLRKDLTEMAQNTNITLIKNLAHRYVKDHIVAPKMKYLFETYCGYELAGEYYCQFGDCSPERYKKYLSTKYRKVLLDNKNK